MAKHQITALREAGTVYAALMEEIKRRVEVIQRAVSGHYSLPSIVALELCYVQLRKVCEVFALACLTAHGEIEGVRRKFLQKTYNADLIIKELGRLHPQFYPIPSQQRLDPFNGKVVEVVTVASGYLTKDELLNLYGKCGTYLHRGSIRQLLTKWEPTVDFHKIADWVGKITTLLNHHQIQTVQPDRQLWVMMNEKHTGKVHWFIMDQVGPI
jgi:hypothetical protein